MVTKNLPLRCLGRAAMPVVASVHRSTTALARLRCCVHRHDHTRKNQLALPTQVQMSTCVPEP